MSSAFASFLIILSFPVTLAAQSDQDFRILHEYKSSTNQAFLIVREEPHRLGQPYQLELRVRCGDSTASDPLKLPIHDSFSACDIDPSSVKVNTSQTALALKTKMADVETYNDQVAQGIKSPILQCLNSTSVLKFSLQNICP